MVEGVGLRVIDVVHRFALIACTHVHIEQGRRDEHRTTYDVMQTKAKPTCLRVPVPGGWDEVLPGKVVSTHRQWPLTEHY